ncbi:MAG: NAD(P)/FAD-dependent oxidoreductase [Terrimicrobiaceae bacterium]|nr:NAD(P)/FAD-dependent oxidoreductase [Terrimicrobiaceae bacterium]
MNEYDFAVVGGGSAGYAAARTAVAHGLRTVVIDGAKELGGLCILRGCMPSKTLLESARRYRVMRKASEFGLRAEGVGFDAGAIVARKRQLIGEFADYRRQQLESGGFDLLRGSASWNDGVLSVNDRDGGQSTVRARRILISTGSKISRPPIPGLSDVAALDSDDILELESLPASLIILGAGPVALEMATYCHSLGTAVTVVQRNVQVLTGADRDCADAVEAGMRKEGVTLFTGTRIEQISRTPAGVSVRFSTSTGVQSAVAAAILNALGREPQLAGFEQAGLATAAGRLTVDARQRTSHPEIFAAGDVCGPYEVVHTAIHQGEVAARNVARDLGALDGPPEEIDYRLKLFAVFSEPQFAAVGATESELRAAGVPFRKATYPFADHGKSLVMGETEGFVKVTAHRVSGEILGAAVVGPDAAEIIHEAVVAMRYRATVAEFATIPHYHPTLSEIWTYPAEELAHARD